MTPAKANEVCEWLKSLIIPQRQFDGIYPAAVTLDGQEYFGAHYNAINEYTESMRAVTHGTHKVGDKYRQEYFYLLCDKLPKRVNRVCYPWCGYEWFFGGYYQGRPGEFNPFGSYFQMTPWTDQNEKIDHYERRPYKRLAMSVRQL